MNEKFIVVESDNKYPSGYGVDSKNVGNALDEIFDEMDRKKIKIIPKLMELKQYLRFKGNSRREQGDLSLWKVYQEVN